MFTANDIANAAKRQLVRMQTDLAEKEAYVELIDTMLAGSMTRNADEAMVRGEWRIIRTTAEEPFILSDTPVVTWARNADRFDLGIGFERPNVEVILPISPTVCLQVLPDVQRTFSAETPTVAEINIIQAAFARQSCFADRKSENIDSLVQSNINKLRIGENVFSLRHRNFDEMFYDMMMKKGQSS